MGPSPHFDNRFTRSVPADPDERNTRRQVRGACFSFVDPTPVRTPRLIAHATEVATSLDLDIGEDDQQELAAVLSGNAVWRGMRPYASCYGGHQFGNWAGQLGDGRAISLGELRTSSGQYWELQLKGAGPTPYSRSGDGRAVMRSSVREFLCSEAMFHLGVPTTRALSLVATGDEVVRDMFYSGDPKPEPGAIVCRVAPTFLRFGHFEILAARDEYALLRQLVDYTIETYFPELGRPSKETYCRWLAQVASRTAVMIAHWMRVGFVHGVMNTDNMSILGLTIDYGPYGWLDDFDPDWTPNTTDAQGRRYRYGHQPRVALWNLVRLANAIFPLVEDATLLETALETYGETLEREHRKMSAQKLGLMSLRDEDGPLIDGLLRILQATETDMTLFYRCLADVRPDTDIGQADDALRAPLHEAYYAPDTIDADTGHEIATWLRRYVERSRAEKLSLAERRTRMNAANPLYVLRNYLAQLAIDRAEQNDGARVLETLNVMRRPYDAQPGREAYAAKRPEWAKDRPGCSMLSCSS